MRNARARRPRRRVGRPSSAPAWARWNGPRARRRRLERARTAHQGCQDGIFSLDAEIRTARERFDSVVQALHARMSSGCRRAVRDRIRDRVLEDHGIDLESYTPAPDPVPRAPRRRRLAAAAGADGETAGAEAGEAVAAGAGNGDLSEEAVSRFEGEGEGPRRRSSTTWRSRGGAEAAGAEEPGIEEGAPRRPTRRRAGRSGWPISVAPWRRWET